MLSIYVRPDRVKVLLVFPEAANTAFLRTNQYAILLYGVLRTNQNTVVISGVLETNGL